MNNMKIHIEIPMWLLVMLIFSRQLWTVQGTFLNTLLGGVQVLYAVILMFSMLFLALTTILVISTDLFKTENARITLSKLGAYKNTFRGIIGTIMYWIIVICFAITGHPVLCLLMTGIQLQIILYRYICKHKLSKNS